MEKKVVKVLSESRIQEQIVKTLRKIDNLIVFSVPNELAGSQARRMSQFIRTGLLAGVSDLIVIYHGAVYFIEVKTQKGKQSDRQKRFQTKVERQGFDYYIVRSVQDVLSILS